MSLILVFLLNAIALLITDSLVPGIEIQDFQTAVFVALTMGIINTFTKPLLSLLTAPLNFFTLTLFNFVINAGLLYIVSLLVPGFIVSGAESAIIGAVVLSLVASVLSFLVKTAKRVSAKHTKKKG